MRNPLARAALLFGGVFILVTLLGRIFVADDGGSRPAALGGNQVALLSLEGEITASDLGDSFWGGPGVISSPATCEDLYAIAEDDAIEAVVLRINSPGGSAAASDEIYRAIKKVQAAGKPVVVSMGDVAASGGYYIAAASDHIVANGATLTGSIGVIFQLLNIEGLAEKLGVRDITLHAGEYKDVGSPWRDMTAEEKQILSDLLTQVHNQFIHAVDEGRANLDEQQVRKLATGQIWTGEGALKAGLVDEVGDLRAAELKAKQLAKLPEDATVVRYGESSWIDGLFGVRGRQTDLSSQVARRMGASLLSELAGSLLLNTTVRDLRLR